MTIRRLSFVAALSLLARATLAQCGSWSTEFGGAGIPLGQVNAVASWDDGSGAQLYVAGFFTAAGGIPVNNVARWDGARFHDVGGGLDGEVNDLLAWDDGSGSKLYACGHFTTASGQPLVRVARWDGFAWQQVGDGLNGEALCLAVHDHGGGPTLHVGGHFANTITNVRYAGRLVGATWTPLPGPFLNGAVLDLASFDDGSGPALVATGEFYQAGATPLWFVAQHRGAQWAPIGSHPTTPGLSGGEGSTTRGKALATRLELGVPALYVGGHFTSVMGVPARFVARWSAGAWSALGAGIGTPNYDGVTALRDLDDGSGPALYVAGNFSGAGPTAAQRIARWRDGAWSELDTGLSGLGAIGALARHDDGTGPALYVAGAIQQGSGETLNQVARWNGARFSPLGGGQGVGGAVRALAGGSVGGVTALFVGNDWSSAGGSPAGILRRWDGVGWTNLGTAIPASIHGADVASLRVADLGAGARLYVGGTFEGFDGVLSSHAIAWTGSGWETVASSIFHPSTPSQPAVVFAIEVFDFGSGPELVLGGQFSSHNHVARCSNGQATPLGAGLPSAVRALAVYDDGLGPRLYAGGAFGATHGCVAVWNGTLWLAAGSGIPAGGAVYALRAFDDGSGSRLYAGGQFTVAGGAAGNHVARWDGLAWTGVGAGMDAGVTAFAVHDAGSGPRLHAVGDFLAADGNPAARIARWEGGAWSEVGGGLTGTAFPTVLAAAGYDDPVTGPSLAIGGTFAFAGGLPSANLASRSGCGPIRFCFGDGGGSACPCGNHSAPELLAGCLSSVGTPGALDASGEADLSADTLALHGSGMPGTATALYFQGSQPLQGGNGVAFGDGLRCASGTIVRLGARTNVAGASGYGGPLGDVPISVRGAIPPGGGTYVYQVWYRNSAPFCTPAGFNLSNGVSVVWRP